MDDYEERLQSCLEECLEERLDECLEEKADRCEDECADRYEDPDEVAECIDECMEEAEDESMEREEEYCTRLCEERLKDELKERERTSLTFYTVYLVMTLRSVFESPTNAIIAINTIVFIGELLYPPIVFYGALIPALVFYRPRTLLTYAFLHANFRHLFFNMFFLRVIGKYVENIIGKDRFVAIYLLIAFLVGILHALVSLTIIPQYARVPSIGASGAVMGVLGLSVVYIGDRTMYVILFPIPIPMRMRVKTLALAIFVIETLLAIFNIAPYIAHDAHIFGLALGYFIGVYSQRPRRRPARRRRAITIRRIKARPRYVREFYPEDVIAIYPDLTLFKRVPELIKKLLRNPTDDDVREAIALIMRYDPTLAFEISTEMDEITVKELAALLIITLLNRLSYLAERGLVKLRTRRLR